MSEPHSWPSTQIPLLQRLRGSTDSAAWDQFVDVYRPLLAAACRRRGLQEADAEDVVQNVLLEVRKGIAGFNYDPVRGRFRNWLGTIMVRQIARYRKRQRRAVQGSGDGIVGLSAADDEAAWVVEFNRHVLRVAIERTRPCFEPEVWNAFNGVWFDDDRPADVAARLSRTPAWVYRAKYRVLQRLKQELGYLTDDIAAFSKQ